MKVHTPIRRLVSSLLAVAMLLPAQPLALAEESGSTSSIATNALNGISSVVTAANTFVNSYGASGVQLNALAAKLSGVQNMAGMLQNQQNAFNQAQILLQQALTEAQSCMSKATHDYSKYKKAKYIPMSRLPAIVPTCKNYGSVLDAVGKANEQMHDTRKKMACLQNLQNTVNQIAERAKQPFQQLVNSANEVWQTYDQILTTHKNIVEKIKGQVDGENGYRAKLNDLKKLSIKLNGTLNGAPGQAKEGEMPTGLAQAVDNLKIERADLANKWYGNIIGQTQSCFYSTESECFNGMTMAPAQCLSAYLNNSGTYDSSTTARNSTNQGRLNQVFNLNYGKVNSNEFPANLDTKRPEVFLDFAQKRFDSIVSVSQQTLLSQRFLGKVDKKAMAAFMAKKYQDCYQRATTTFKAQMVSRVGEYPAMAKAVTDKEAGLANDIKTTIDLVSGQMNEFRTQFHQVYNADLPQFTDNCTATDNPYESLDCLRILKATLTSGIKGTAATYKMNDGSMHTIDPGVTNLPMQTLVMDAQGKPSVGSANIQCRGFDDCINVLDKSRQSHESEIQKQTDDQTKFVQNNNKAMQASMDGMSGLFGQMSQLMLAGVKGINQDLVNIGIHGTLKTKQAETEELTTDETTKLYKMPKNMKAAMAGRNSYSEIDDSSTSDVVSSYNDLARTLNDKASEAGKMKYNCKIDKEEYDALARVMPDDCSNVQKVCGDHALSAATQLDTIFRKSQNIPPEDSSNVSSLVSQYNSCRNEQLSIANEVTTSDIYRAAGGRSKLYKTIKDPTTGEETEVRRDGLYEDARAQAQSDNRKSARAEGKATCSDNLFSPLLANAGKGRTATLKSQHANIVNALRNVMDSCSTKEIDEDDVQAACEAFKKTARSASPPTGEEESKVDDAGHSEPAASNPLVQPGVPSSINAN